MRKSGRRRMAKRRRPRRGNLAHQGTVRAKRRKVTRISQGVLTEVSTLRESLAPPIRLVN